MFRNFLRSILSRANRVRVMLVAAIFAVACGAMGQDVGATIKQEAENCVKALSASDFDGMVRYTHPRVVQLMGGKDAMIAVLKRGMAQMRDEGTGFGEVKIGAPGEPTKIGDQITSIVPQHLVMKVPGGKLEVDSNLLGLSEDGGKHWVFVDLGGISKEQFGKVFPELDGKIAFPERKQPVFKKDE